MRIVPWLGTKQGIPLERSDGSVEVRPRWVAIADCGSARRGPRK